MKKLISFIVLIALCITLFGCAKAPIDSASPDLLVENKVQDPAPVTDEPQPEQTPQQTPDEPTAETPPSKTEDNEPESEAVAYKPSKFDISDDFRPYEVVITLTENETKLDKYYTVSDFSYIDIYHIFLQEHYYDSKEYPEYKNCRTLIALLNEPSKARVLEYCEKLEKDSRVLFARPNVEALTNEFWFYPRKDLREFPWYLKSSDFPEVDCNIVRYANARNNFLFATINCETADEEKIFEQLKKAINSDKFDYVEPIYECTYSNRLIVYPTEERLKLDKEFSADEFPEVNISEVWYFDDYKPRVELSFYETDKRIINQAKIALESNRIVESVKKITKSFEPITGYEFFIPENPTQIETPKTAYGNTLMK